jgi:predicted nuclease with TOPRIM domain
MLVCMARKKVRRVPDGVAARDRYFSAVLEDLNGKFSLLLEGYDTLDVNVENMAVRMEHMEREMKCFSERMGNLEEKFEALFEGQQEFFEEIRHVNLRITALEGGF